MGDYDRETRKKKGPVIRLKEKDQSELIRIVSRPYREPKVWPSSGGAPLKDEEVARFTQEQWYEIYKDPAYEVKEVFSWIVIDREDGQARIFSATPSVYEAIKEYALKEQWGDPRLYDIEITRAELPGKGYYQVVAMPDKSSITTGEIERAKKVDIAKLLPNARPAVDEQIDDVSDHVKDLVDNMVEDEANTAPYAPDAVVPMDDGKPINLDDIPF